MIQRRSGSAKHRSFRIGLLAALAVLVLPAGPDLWAESAHAQGCGPGSPVEVGEPLEVAVERWEYEGGNLHIHGVTSEGVIVSMATPGCVLSLVSVFSLDPYTGEERWQLDGDLLGSDAGHIEQHGETILLTRNGGLSRLDPSTGDEQWSQSTGDSYPYIAAIDDESIFIAGEDTFTALNTETGDVRWQSSLSIQSQRWVSASNELLLGLDYRSLRAGPVDLVGLAKSSGSVKWKIAVGETFDSIALIPSLQLVGDDRVVVCVCGDQGSTVTLVDLSSGSILWQRSDLGTVPLFVDPLVTNPESPVIVMQIMKEIEQTELVALDSASGDVQWRSSAIKSTVAPGSAGIIGPLSDPELAGHLGALDPVTGELLWSALVPGLSSTVNGVAPTSLVSGGVLAVASGSPFGGSTVIAIDLATGEYRWVAQYPEFEAVSVEAEGAGAFFVQGVSGGQTSLIALEVTSQPA